VQDVNFYFDFKVSRNEVYTNNEMTEMLPEKLKSDIMLAQYNSFVEKCILFRTKLGQIDITLASTVLRELTIHTYLIDQYILKLG
jgi:hypothetical protein